MTRPGRRSKLVHPPGTVIRSISGKQVWVVGDNGRWNKLPAKALVNEGQIIDLERVRKYLEAIGLKVDAVLKSGQK